MSFNWLYLYPSSYFPGSRAGPPAQALRTAATAEETAAPGAVSQGHPGAQDEGTAGPAGNRESLEEKYIFF